jgi:CheY-like chemotaxis protein
MLRRPATVLVVDDNPDMQELARAVLQPAGHRVISANNGKEALDLLCALPEPDVVILDLRMPVMEGQELLGILRAYKRLAHIPVAVISAVDDDERVDVRPLVEACLAKPVRPQALLQTVELLLAQPPRPA